MGSTIQNSYLFPAPGKDELAEGLRLSLESLGYESVEPDEAFDIVFKINEQEGERSYVSIEAGGIDDVEGFIKALSDSFACDVLHASLFDSDYLQLAYHSHNLNRSVIVSAGVPEWAEDEIRQGDFGGFLEIVHESADKTGLEANWSVNYISADERLNDLLPFLMYEKNLLPADTNPFVLRFKKLGDGSYEIIRKGPPLLRHPLLPLTIFNHQAIHLLVANAGGPSKGFSILLYGESIIGLMDIPEQCGHVTLYGHLDPTVKSSPANRPEKFVMDTVFNAYTSSDGTLALRADFPDVQIPDGLVIDRKKRYNHTPAYVEFESFFWINAQFEFAITKPIDAEKLDLILQISPHENWAEGSIILDVELLLTDGS